MLEPENNDELTHMTDESLALEQPYEIVSVQRAEPPPGTKGSNIVTYCHNLTEIVANIVKLLHADDVRLRHTLCGDKGI